METHMSLSIYKPGQGYWTRVLTAIGAGTLVLSCLAWVISQFTHLDDKPRLIIQSSIAVGVILVASGLMWYLLNKPRIVDFMIATEAEMRKVNWPTKHEIFASTLVVITGTMVMSLFLWLVNMASAWFFQKIGVLG